MNPVEQAFSDSLNDRGPGQSISISKDRETIRRSIHEDEALCSYLLSTVKAPAGALKIRQSTIPDSGSGLFTTRDLAAGELIFTSVPLVLCAEVGESKEACDFCFQQRRRAIHPLEDRLAHPGETLPDVYKCMGCNLYQYCSEV
jgi:SET and MYND domain-containing protein